MFKVNEYFDGTVKSIAFGTAEGPATIGTGRIRIRHQPA